MHQSTLYSDSSRVVCDSAFFPSHGKLSHAALHAAEAVPHISWFARPSAAPRGLPISLFPVLTAVKS